MGGEGKEKGEERGGEWEQKGRRGERKGDGKGFAGPMSNCFLRACYA